MRAGGSLPARDSYALGYFAGERLLNGWGNEIMKSDELASRPYLSIPAEFNIARAIVDRHVAAGRGAKVTAWFDDRSYT